MELKKKQLEYFYMGVFIAVVALVFIMNSTNYLPYNLVVIDNSDPNSMWPTYAQGDIFILENKGADTFEIGDVLVYTKSTGANIIHRIVDIQIINDEYYFRVKGDNIFGNTAPDNLNSQRIDGETYEQTLIPYSDVLGIMVLRVPEIGHLSLAIQNNPLIRSITFIIAGALFLAIIFWPEDDKEDEDEVIEVSLDKIKAEIKNSITPLVRFFKPEKGSPIYRLLILIFLILLLITPMFVASFLSVDYDYDKTGIVDVTFDNPREIKEITKGYDFLFVQAKVNFYDAGGYFESLRAFDINVYTEKGNTSSLISHTRWETLRDMRGSVITGGSILIHADDIPPNGTTLYVEIPFEIQHLFSTETGLYETTFVLAY